MKPEERIKLERIEGLLMQLQKDHEETCRKIQSILDTIGTDLEEDWDDPEEEVIDEKLVNHMEELLSDED